MCLADPDGSIVAETRGTFDGTVIRTPAGENGFGYDPLFAPEGWAGRSMAQASSSEKTAISHRGRAFRQLPRLLRELGLLPD